MSEVGVSSCLSCMAEAEQELWKEGRKKQKDTLVRMVGVQTYKIISVNTCRSYIDYYMMLQ